MMQLKSSFLQPGHMLMTHSVKSPRQLEHDFVNCFLSCGNFEIWSLSPAPQNSSMKPIFDSSPIIFLSDSLQPEAKVHENELNSF